MSTREEVSGWKNRKKVSSAFSPRNSDLWKTHLELQTRMVTRKVKKQDILFLKLKITSKEAIKINCWPLYQILRLAKALTILPTYKFCRLISCNAFIRALPSWTFASFRLLGDARNQVWTGAHSKFVNSYPVLEGYLVVPDTNLGDHGLLGELYFSTADYLQGFSAVIATV